jgi:tetratricopeptide (TPR) repeat protein
MLKALIYQLKRTDFLLISIIVVIGFMARMAYITDYANTEVFPILKGSDSYCYYIWAKDIASGDILGKAAFMKWPLYAYFLGFWMSLFGENIAVIYIFQFFLGIINAVLLYFIGRQVFNRSVGFIAGLFYVWYGLFIFYEGLLIYTSLSLLLNSIFFLYLFYLNDNFKKTSYFGAGLLLGLATAAQANIMIFGVLAVFYLSLQNRPNFRKIFINLSIFLLGFSIIIGGITLRNYLVEKDLVFIAGNGGMNFYLGNNPQASGGFSSGPFNRSQEEMFVESKAMAKVALGMQKIKTSAASEFWFKKSFEFIKDNPRAYFRLLLNKFILIFSPTESVFETEYRFIVEKVKIFKYMLLDLQIVLPFACLGIIFSLKMFRKAAWLYLAVISFTAGMLLFLVAARYRIVILPFLFIFAGLTIFSLWEMIKNRRFISFAAHLVLLAGFIILFGLKPVPARENIQSRRSGEDFDFHFYKAMFYDNLGQYEKESEELGIADSIMPGNAKVVFSYGLIFAQQGNFQLAEYYFKKAIEISPFYVNAYYNLGFIYNRQAKFTQAKQILERAIFLNPDDLGSHFELAKANKALGNHYEAKKGLELVLERVSPWRKEEIALARGELENLN